MLLSRYERMIARRYLLPGRGEAFIFMVASISLVAVTLGVAALVVVMSVMNGFRAELFDKIVGLNGHAVIQGYDNQLPDWRAIVAQAKRTPGITSATPLIEQPLMAGYSGRVEGVLVRGMREQDILNNPTIADNVKVGSLKQLTPGSGNIAIGSRLAQALGANIGSEIALISPQGPATPFGTVPRIVSYRVAAIFEVGVYDYDKQFVIMPMQDAQTLLLMGDNIGMVELDTVDADKVDQIVAPLARRYIDEAQVSTWKTMNAQLFEALKVDRLVTFTVVSIIILVAVFNILSSLIMLVRAKTRDIAILRTMGATRASLIRIFMTVGTTIGALGIGTGLVLGFLLIEFRQGMVQLIGLVTGQEIWDPSMRYLTELPAKTDPVEVVGIVLMALTFSVLATLYPAFKAASTDPVQVLRYE
ncbi:lipoprotein-releasing ABC transporter permease subunit [Stakelama pacifica]|uniref:Lipoprotein-releasing system permease protein n=1 Tax=Stakelama pacifica TaxID=517720 RepID=A0A4R6FYA7_9SPHN|nr:lipoprotein-releasing ABC transporter permease subunit [Stakelama pacifica]MAX00289.1 lipoprotein-releasing system transmembrane subunit LolC [Sphingomonas sp.]TDN86807.1 lipoprotein-releasing system permease protein [Stakelama pacifica]GGO90730.1 multidrug ABC transporter substrate-binding protein [Stakelama pacifica]